jgi:hypothetical protein
LCKHVAGHIGGPPGKGGLRTVPKSFMERFFINGGRISGGQLLCCAIAVLGKEKSQDVEEIKQLYEIVIRELERFVADEDRRSTVAKLFSLKEIDIEMCVERVRVLQLSLKSIRQGHGGLANECYLGASLDFAALFSSKEFAARSFLIFEQQQQDSDQFMASLWMGIGLIDAEKNGTLDKVSASLLATDLRLFDYRGELLIILL